MARFTVSKGGSSDHGISWFPENVDQDNATYGPEIISDTTETKMLRKSIRETEEAYRKQVSRDLHDGIGQALNTMGLYVSLAKETLGEDQQAALEHLCRLESLVQHTVKETHRLAMNLRPSVLDDSGLVPALRLLCEDFGARTGIGVHLTTTLVNRLGDRDVESALYRITQECLCNIEKHARATQTAIELDQKDSTLTLRVRDNGSGFDAREASNKGMGLMSMQERASLLGGHVAIKSKKKQGTEVKIEISNGHHAEGDVGSCPHLPF
jgi:two-component system sensor histidine kinase NreB